MEGFSVIFLSILLEALPFVLLGTIISSIIELFITPEWLNDHLPKRSLTGFFLAGLVGLIFPVCECAIVPIMRRLLKKGLPIGMAITFMLATPIVNPVVILSTHYAFPNQWLYPLLRGSLGYVGAILIGMIMSAITSKREIKKEALQGEIHCGCGHNHDHDHSHSHHEHHHGHHHECHHEHHQDCEKAVASPRRSLKTTIIGIVEHTGTELYEVGRFLILGAFISAAMQVFVPREWIIMLGKNQVMSIFLMMLLAFILSLCSEADAFIAATFRDQFSGQSLIAFLIFGPMIDIKNTLMLSVAFKPKFIIKLIAVITVVCTGLALLSGLWL